MGRIPERYGASCVSELTLVSTSSGCSEGNNTSTGMGEIGGQPNASSGRLAPHAEAVPRSAAEGFFPRWRTGTTG